MTLMKINIFTFIAVQLLFVLPIGAFCQNSGFSRTVNPEIPYKTTFAGTSIDLDRVDMFERLDR